MDLDTTIAKHTLERKIGRLLASPTIASTLRASDLEVVDVTTPKQTATTQRWKLGLRRRVGGAREPVRTKIEFSRRGPIEGAELEAVDGAVAGTHALPRFLAAHYDLARAIVQKITALADRDVAQARDVFDLNVLFARAGELAPPSPAKSIDAAIDRALGIGYDDFAAHVLAFLEPAHASLYRTKEAWNVIQSSVIGRLERLQRGK